MLPPRNGHGKNGECTTTRDRESQRGTHKRAQETSTMTSLEALVSFFDYNVYFIIYITNKVFRLDVLTNASHQYHLQLPLAPCRGHRLSDRNTTSYQPPQPTANT